MTNWWRGKSMKPKHKTEFDNVMDLFFFWKIDRLSAIVHVFTKTPPTQMSRKVVRFMQNEREFILYTAQRTNVNMSVYIYILKSYIKWQLIYYLCCCCCFWWVFFFGGKGSEITLKSVPGTNQYHDRKVSCSRKQCRHLRGFQTHYWPIKSQLHYPLHLTPHPPTPPPKYRVNVSILF